MMIVLRQHPSSARPSENRARRYELPEVTDHSEFGLLNVAQMKVRTSPKLNDYVA